MQGLGKITTKKMFGALGFYQGSAIFACLFDGDVFYFKASGALAEELKAECGKAFVYQGKSGKSVNMPYITAPAACLDDPDQMLTWSKKAIAAAPKKKTNEKTLKH